MPTSGPLETRTGERSSASLGGGIFSGWLGVAVVFILLSIAGYTTYDTFTTAPAVAPAEQETDFICAKTLQHFRHRRQPGERYPVFSPASKEYTGYPAEKCYWTRDGSVKLEPSYVLLNEYIGKKGPTICPDCGRLVEPHNPMPPGERFKAVLARSASSRPAATPAPTDGPR